MFLDLLIIFRSQPKSRQKVFDISAINNSTLSSGKISSSEACLVEAPTFHPSEKDFQDPLEYIDKIRPAVEKYGICRVIPPPNFKVISILTVYTIYYIIIKNE